MRLGPIQITRHIPGGGGNQQSVTYYFNDSLICTIYEIYISDFISHRAKAQKSIFDKM